MLLEHPLSEDFYKSKSAVKREFNQSKNLVRLLLDLSEGQIRQLPIPIEVSDSLIEAKKLKKGALNRQVRYINGKFAQLDIDEIEKTYYQILAPKRQEVAVFHRVERLRDELLSGKDGVIEKAVEIYPLERNQLRQLVRNTQSDNEKIQKRAYRELFKVLREAVADET